MKQFDAKQLREAKACADVGGQGLHVYQYPVTGLPGAPAVFNREAAAGRPWAHLFDADADRLRKTARRLGVQAVFIQHQGTSDQHVDLCGAPLRRAIAECAL